MMHQAEFAISSRLSEIDRLHDKMDALGQQWTLSQEVLYACTLALEEILTNIIKYGFSDNGEHAITIKATMDSGGKIQLVVQDDGKPFNPLDSAVPDVAASVEDRPIGGLGILLVRKMMDDVRYARFGKYNVLTLVKNSR